MITVLLSKPQVMCLRRLARQERKRILDGLATPYYIDGNPYGRSLPLLDNAITNLEQGATD